VALNIMLIILGIVGACVYIAFVARNHGGDHEGVNIEGPNVPATNLNPKPDPQAQPLIPPQSSVETSDPNPSSDPSVAMNLRPAGNGIMDLRPVFPQPEGDEVMAFSPVLTIVMLTFSSIVLGVKIATIILAAKMAKMIRERRVQNLAHPVVKRPPPTQPKAVQPTPAQPAVMYIPINMQPTPYNMGPYNPYFQQPIMYNPYLQPQFQSVQYTAVQPRQQV